MKRLGIMRGALLALAAGALAGVAAAQDIRIPIDSAQPLRLSAPAHGIALGNASIAGVSVQNEQMLFVTGRSYGATSLTVVGENGRVLFAGNIIVTPNEAPGTLTVIRGVETQRLACNPTCRPNPEVGDAMQGFAETYAQMSQHQAAGAGGRGD